MSPFRPPFYEYAQKMREVSKSWVTDVSLADSNTTEGSTEILKLYSGYQPAISPCGQVRAKGAVNGERRILIILQQFTDVTLVNEDSCSR